MALAVSGRAVGLRRTACLKPGDLCFARRLLQHRLKQHAAYLANTSSRTLLWSTVHLRLSFVTRSSRFPGAFNIRTLSFGDTLISKSKACYNPISQHRAIVDISLWPQSRRTDWRRLVRVHHRQYLSGRTITRLVHTGAAAERRTANLSPTICTQELQPLLPFQSLLPHLLFAASLEHLVLE